MLLLPGAAYHLAEIIPLADELERRGVSVRIAVGEPHWDRVRQGLVDSGRDIYSLPSPERVSAEVAAILTMKDWAGYRPYVQAAQASQIPTLAKVEGVQDFAEVDSTNAFRPYRTADHILCQGTNDFEMLNGSRYIVGSTRLERLMRAPLRVPRSRMAVINLNFSYGVLTESRDIFLSSAIAGCVGADIPYVVAVHPALVSNTTDPAFTNIPISRLLENASVLISRFSTVPYEAMARGVPFIYHNPHRELVSTFKTPDGAFRETTTPTDLESAIVEAQEWRIDYRERAHDFFSSQVDIDDHQRSEQRTADVVEALLR